MYSMVYNFFFSFQQSVKICLEIGLKWDEKCQKIKVIFWKNKKK